MAREPTADELRAMAAHRGFKLVRSRKRTPGVGDFGKFGLKDAKDKPVMGFGAQGLTASAAEIEEFLRRGAASSWKASAEQKTPPKTQVRAASKPRSAQKPELAKPATKKRNGVSRTRGRGPRARSRGAGRQVPPPPRAKPALNSVAPAPAPALHIRTAGKDDAKALLHLVRQLPDPPSPNALAARIETTGKAGGLLLAEYGEPVGCCAWTIVATLQYGPVGRITLLFVEARHRRRGIGSALLDRAETIFAKRGCTMIEAMSDIRRDNAHGFFRDRAFEQTSYRFVRPVGAPKRQ